MTMSRLTYRGFSAWRCYLKNWHFRENWI